MTQPRKELLAERDDLFVVHDFLSPDECADYATMIESVGYGDDAEKRLQLYKDKKPYRSEPLK